MDVNKYRHLCRLQIAGCPELSPAHKVVLMTLTDYINRKTFIAWPDFDTLAENCDVDRRTAIRAINEVEGSGTLSAFVGAARWPAGVSQTSTSSA